MADEVSSVTDQILVVRLGGLREVVQVMGAAAAIRAHHRAAHIVFLTRRPYAGLAGQAPYFDEVRIEERSSWGGPAGWLRRGRQPRTGEFARVYDFQSCPRSAASGRLLGRARSARRGSAGDRLHILDRQEELLRSAGVPGPVPLPNLSWAASDPSRFGLPADYALIVPGGGQVRPERRWPPARYAQLAGRLAASGIAPVIVGGAGARPLGRAIGAAVRGAYDLTGEAGFGDVVALGGWALSTIGGDTGYTHLAVAGGSPAIVLCSAVSDPALSAPRGADVAILHRNDLADLSVAEVAATLRLR